MPDFREVMAAEADADESAALAHKLGADDATDVGGCARAQLQMLAAIRLEIRAQGMRFDYSITEASKQ